MNIIKLFAEPVRKMSPEINNPETEVYIRSSSILFYQSRNQNMVGTFKKSFKLSESELKLTSATAGRSRSLWCISSIYLFAGVRPFLPIKSTFWL